MQEVDHLANGTSKAALFSAIVTTFVVQSYPALQADPNDMTHALLSQISLQLSAFVVSGDSITSVAQPLPTTPDMFTPDPNDVLVNGLWFTSLTLSVLSAFFAIGMQQWLRSLSLPSHLSLWSTIRLRQRRYRNAIRFQLPNIMALLPALLQLAAVLFLLGLFFLLRPLNNSIAVLYAVLTGLPFLLYGVSLVLPLFWIDCPLKSPFVPSVVFIFSWCKILLLVITLYVFIIPTTFIVKSLQACRTSKLPQGGLHSRLLTHRIEQVTANFRFRVAMSAAPLVPRTQEFWTEREVRRLYDTHMKAMRDYGDALAHAPQLTHRTNLAKVQACLRLLKVGVRVKCVLTWVHLYFGNYSKSTLRHTYKYRQWSPISPELLDKVEPNFGNIYTGHLLEALPSEKELFEMDDREFMTNIENLSSILMLLTRIVTHKTGNRTSWSTVVDALIKAQCELERRLAPNDGQGLSLGRANTPYLHILAVCLFRCFKAIDFRFSRHPTDEGLYQSSVCLLSWLI